MRYWLLIGLIFLGGPLWADEVTAPNAPAAPSSNTQPQETPEDRDYKVRAEALEAQIAQKINQIQNKQREIDTEIYPAFVAPLQGEKKALVEQLNNLMLQKQEMQSERSVKVWNNQMSAPPSQK